MKSYKQIVRWVTTIWSIVAMAGILVLKTGHTWQWLFQSLIVAYGCYLCFKIYTIISFAACGKSVELSKRNCLKMETQAIVACIISMVFGFKAYALALIPIAVSLLLCAAIYKKCTSQ